MQCYTFPLETTIHKVFMNYPMISVNDCGLFTLEYVVKVFAIIGNHL